MKKRWKLSAKWWHVSPFKRCLEDSFQWPLLIFKPPKCANHCIIFHHTRKCLHFYFCGAGAGELLEKKLALCYLSEADGVGNTESRREGDYCVYYITASCFVLVQSCLILWDPMDCSSPSFSVRGIFCKNTGVGCHFLLQGIFPTQGSKPHLLHLLHWQVGSLPREPPGKPVLLFANSLFDNHHLTIIP